MKQAATFGLPAVMMAGFLAANVQANPLICTYGELSRKIEVVYADPGHPVPCEVIYDKSAEGSIETLWRAYNEAGYCEARAAGLVETLTGMGWQCIAPSNAPSNAPSSAEGDVNPEG